jgi:hypothetical protein
MNILAEVVKELFGMFVADARLALSVLALVIVVALLVGFHVIAPLAGGLVLLAGSLAIVIEAVVREARRR